MRVALKTRESTVSILEAQAYMKRRALRIQDLLDQAIAVTELVVIPTNDFY